MYTSWKTNKNKIIIYRFGYLVKFYVHMELHNQSTLSRFGIFMVSLFFTCCLAIDRILIAPFFSNILAYPTEQHWTTNKKVLNIIIKHLLPSVTWVLISYLINVYLRTINFEEVLIKAHTIQESLDNCYKVVLVVKEVIGWKLRYQQEKTNERIKWCFQVFNKNAVVIVNSNGPNTISGDFTSVGP